MISSLRDESKKVLGMYVIINGISMAPTHSKPQPLLGTCQLGTHKHILATSLADPNNVDTAAIKCHKLEEAAAVR